MSSANTIHKIKPSSNFTIVRNDIIEDDRLAMETKTLLLYLLSRPLDWVVNVHQLQKLFGVGEKKIRRLLAELIEVGYVKRTQSRDDCSNRFLKTRYDVYDVPQLGIQREKSDAKDFTSAGSEDPQGGSGLGGTTSQRELNKHTKKNKITRTENNNPSMAPFEKDKDSSSRFLWQEFQEHWNLNSTDSFMRAFRTWKSYPLMSKDLPVNMQNNIN